MSVLDFQQTDTQADCTIPGSGGGNIYCTGFAGHALIRRERLASIGGTAGSGSLAYTDVGTIEQMRYLVQVNPGSSSSIAWSSGTWTIRWNVTTANMNVTWGSVFICRVNSSCLNQQTLGSSTSVAVSLGTTGAKSTTVSVSAATSPSATDRIVIIYSLFASMAGQSVTCSPSEINSIDDGLAAAAADWLPSRASYGQYARLRR